MINSDQWQALRRELFKDSRILQADYDLIIRIFLSKAFPNETFHSLTNKEILEKYWNLLGGDDSEGELIDEDIPRYICQKLLWLETTPQYEFFRLYNQAKLDIKNIEETIQEYTNRSKEIDSQLHAKFDEETQSQKYLLIHYLQLNREALSEIQEFIIKDLPEEAIEKSQRQLFPNPFYTPYSYRFLPELKYDLDFFSDITNKFGNLGISNHRALRDLFKQNKDEFLAKALEYAQEHNIAEQVRDHINKHHLLAPRKDIIEDALQSFEEKKFLIFIHIAPLQVEGIFHDKCLSLGIEPEKLAQESINPKIKRLRELGAKIRNYEYYAFRFPVTRNKVAHGRYFGESQELMAIMLLLDLFDVSGQITSEDDFTNKVVKLYQDAEVEKLDQEKLELFAILYSEPVPVFYQLQSKIHEIQLKLEEPEFWEELQRKIETLSTLILVGIYRFCKEIRSHLRDKKKLDEIVTKIETRDREISNSTVTTEKIIGILW